MLMKRKSKVGAWIIRFAICFSALSVFLQKYFQTILHRLSTLTTITLNYYRNEVSSHFTSQCFPALMNTVYADLFGWKSVFILLLFFCFLIKYTNNLNRFSGLQKEQEEGFPGREACQKLFSRGGLTRTRSEQEDVQGISIISQEFLVKKSQRSNQ